MHAQYKVALALATGFSLGAGATCWTKRPRPRKKESWVTPPGLSFGRWSGPPPQIVLPTTNRSWSIANAPSRLLRKWPIPSSQISVGVEHQHQEFSELHEGLTFPRARRNKRLLAGAPRV
jgi:hypothetical protein